MAQRRTQSRLFISRHKPKRKRRSSQRFSHGVTIRVASLDWARGWARASKCILSQDSAATTFLSTPSLVDKATLFSLQVSYLRYFLKFHFQFSYVSGLLHGIQFIGPARNKWPVHPTKVLASVSGSAFRQRPCWCQVWWCPYPSSLQIWRRLLLGKQWLWSMWRGQHWLWKHGCCLQS